MRNGENRTMYRVVCLGVILALGLGLSASNLFAGAIIDNGVVKLAVNDQGHLDIGPIGLTFIPTGGEALAPGCACEGWGVADTIAPLSGWASVDDGGISPNLSVVSFNSTASTAVSVVNIADVFEVTHDYHPSVTPNLYEATVSIKNISGAAVNVVYRRVMDWDIPPTDFAEFITIQRGNAADLLYSSDDGFADSDPLSGPSFLNPASVNTSFTDLGPADHGALFDFGFGSLAAGATKSFKIYYGAAASEADANAAVSAVNAEIYCYGQPSTPDGPTLGTPNTFIFAFAGVGGSPILGCTISGMLDTVKRLDIFPTQKTVLKREIKAVNQAVSAHNFYAARANCGVLTTKLKALSRGGQISSSTADSLSACCDDVVTTAKRAAHSGGGMVE